jgi:hypothetical protein
VLDTTTVGSNSMNGTDYDGGEEYYADDEYNDATGEGGEFDHENLEATTASPADEDTGEEEDDVTSVPVNGTMTLKLAPEIISGSEADATGKPKRKRKILFSSVFGKIRT